MKDQINLGFAILEWARENDILKDEDSHNFAFMFTLRRSIGNIISVKNLVVTEV